MQCEKATMKAAEQAPAENENEQQGGAPQQIHKLQWCRPRTGTKLRRQENNVLKTDGTDKTIDAGLGENEYGDLNPQDDTIVAEGDKGCVR